MIDQFIVQGDVCDDDEHDKSQKCDYFVAQLKPKVCLLYGFGEADAAGGRHG
jgi:hypothetical protein